VADEDSAAASFAGQKDSYLLVPADALERRVLDCFWWRSTDRPVWCACSMIRRTKKSAEI
jgi:hypothetical protein